MGTEAAFLAGSAVTVVTSLALLAAERRESRLGIWCAKPLASLGFVLAAAGAGALGAGSGRWIFAGLVLSLCGDVLLIPKSNASFLAGLGAFLLGHVAFACAFVARGIAPGWALATLLAIVPIGIIVWRWLAPHVQAPMKPPVLAYITVISVMLALGVGTFAARAAPLLLSGAVAFFLSDLSVARDRFVAPGFSNRLWGLPLYFGAQLLLAAGSTS